MVQGPWSVYGREVVLCLIDPADRRRRRGRHGAWSRRLPVAIVVMGVLAAHSAIPALLHMLTMLTMLTRG